MNHPSFTVYNGLTSTRSTAGQRYDSVNQTLDEDGQDRNTNRRKVYHSFNEEILSSPIKNDAIVASMPASLRAVIVG